MAAAGWRRAVDGERDPGGCRRVKEPHVVQALAARHAAYDE